MERRNCISAIFMAPLCALAVILSGCAEFFALPVPSAAPDTSLLTPAPSPPTATASASKKASGSSAMPNTDQPSAPTGSPSPAPDKPYALVCRVNCEEYLTLRAAPSVDAGAVGRVPKGGRVRVDGYDGLFAHVAYGREDGYVLSGYLVPLEEENVLEALDVVKPVAEYPYARMVKDLERLAALYPEKLRIESAGSTAEGRDIPVAVLGDPGAGRHILLQGAIHGREHMTGLLLTAQLEYCLKRPSARCGEKTVDEWLEGVCLHVIPMANPDGVAISQQEAMSGSAEAVFRRDAVRGLADAGLAEYARQWKANAAGVDINRTFQPAGRR